MPFRRPACALLAALGMAWTTPSYATPPSNDACDTAISISTPSGLEIKSGTLTGATNDGAASCGSAALSPDVWYIFPGKPGIGGRLTVTTCGTHDTGGFDLGIDTVLSLHTACGGAQLVCNDDWIGDDPAVGHACAGMDTGLPRDSAAQILLTPNTAVLIRVSVYGGSAVGAFTLRVNFEPHVLCCRGTTCAAVAVGACDSLSSGVEAISVATCEQTMVPQGCCYADFDHSGVISIDDLFRFLNSWFVQSPYSNVGGDGTTTPTIDDLFLYLSLWFTNCG